MKLMKAKIAISASALTLAALATPLAAQDEQASEIAAEEESQFESDGELSAGEAAVYGGAGYGIYKAGTAGGKETVPTRALTAEQIRANAANRTAAAGRTFQSGSPNFTQGPPNRAADVIKARDAAAAPRNIQTLESPSANRAAIGNGSALDDLNARGEAAQRARANTIAGSADDVAKMDARGRLAQQIRANKVASPSGSTALASPETMGTRAQAARANVIGGSADDLARLEANGTRAQATRFNRVGSNANLGQLDRQGRFAQDARGRGIGNTSNLDLEARGNAARNTRFQARNVNAAARSGPGFERAMQGRIGPEGTSRLIGQGDAAQAARGRIVNEGQIARNINNAGGDVGRINQAGRNAQAARGVGRGVPAVGSAPGKPVGKLGKITKFGGNMAKGAVVGIAATEGVKALTGAEMDDPLTTGFRYGSAIFDKDVTMGDVARDRWQHHKRNFRKIGETLTTPGKMQENMRAYGADKRQKIGDATGMELHAMRDTRQRYAEAIAKDGAKGAAKVAGDRAKHHWENTKKVGSKVGCGISNIFRKKENDKQC